jgi:hypothetical protein
LVSTERVELVRLVCLDPYEGRPDAGSPITFEHLVSRVLERLISPPEDERASDVIVAVDASRALHEDDGAWAILFQRMNERRNVIADALKGPLVLCLSPRLEATFARAAPDFWSIRSLAVVVDTALKSGTAPELSGETADNRAGLVDVAVKRTATQTGPAPAGGPPFVVAAYGRGSILAGESSNARATARVMTGSNVWYAGIRDLPVGPLTRKALTERVQNGDVTADTLLWREGLDDWSPLRAVRELDDLLRIAQDRHDLAEIESEITSVREKLAHAREDVASLSALKVWLDRKAERKLRNGEPEEGLEAAEESVRIARRLLAQAPDRAERLHDLSMSLARMGDVHRGREDPDRAFGESEDLDRALDAYGESVDLARRLVAKEPERAEWLRDLSVGLAKVGDVHRARGDLDRAQHAYDEAAQLAQRLSAG